jgi:transcriptional regulator with XRE-family HTH domain
MLDRIIFPMLIDLIMETNLSENIKTVRKSLGFTQAELAKQIGCTQATIAKYEAGSIRIPADTYFRIVNLVPH